MARGGNDKNKMTPLSEMTDAELSAFDRSTRRVDPAYGTMEDYEFVAEDNINGWIVTTQKDYAPGCGWATNITPPRIWKIAGYEGLEYARYRDRMDAAIHHKDAVQFAHELIKTMEDETQPGLQSEEGSANIKSITGSLMVILAALSFASCSDDKPNAEPKPAPAPIIATWDDGPLVPIERVTIAGQERFKLTYPDGHVEYRDPRTGITTDELGSMENTE